LVESPSEKTELRRKLKGVEVGAEAAQKVATHLYQWMAPRLPGTVAAYLAMADEVPVEPLFGQLPGWRWVLPRVEEDGSLTFRDRDLPRETHRWGMEQPVESGEPVPVHEIDLILVPGVAFDGAGRRLGRGKGYYDGLLGVRRRDCLAIGVTTADRIIDAVPTEGHDIPVDLLVTEDGILYR
jgi:5-formyltetrahydrofolate cyclo-ligase